MDRDRIEALMAEEFTPARLRPLQIIYLALVMGVVVLFGVGTFLGLQSTGVAWLMLCLQTNVAHIPQIYFGVFLGPLAMLLNAMHYFPTPERIRWWLLSREV